MRLPRTSALCIISFLSFLPAALLCAEEPPVAKPDPLPRFEISVSYSANLVHWIDNLAGSSGGKTIRTYRRYWQGRFGPPTAEELGLLRRWSAIRMHAAEPLQPAPANARGCLPQIIDGPGRRQTFLLLSYDAPSIPDFLDALGGQLDDQEILTIREVMEAFEPRFRKVWEGMTFLKRFEKRFRRYIEESGLRPFLGQVARFLEVDPSKAPPGRIHLMALPQESATFATAIGRDLMMEIRPGDGPDEQVQVIAHETTHYLWQMIPPERLDRMAALVHAASPQGPVAWALLREGLPTAIGQGLAEARLVPRRFGMELTWYHIASIDRFAKSIYPLVDEAIHQGRTFEGAVAPIVGRGSSALEGENAPGEYIAEAIHFLGEGTLPAYGRILRRSPFRHRWVFPSASPEGPEFLERYTCLGGLALVGPDETSDPSRLPVFLRDLLVPDPEAADASRDGAADGPPAAAPLRSGVRMFRRPGGGVIFVLVAATSEDLTAVADLYLRLETVPTSPVWLHPADSP